jgi:hypothetical protein
VAAAAAGGTPAVPCSQEGRAKAAAQELEDFELMYGDLDDLLASQTQSQQQQQQQPGVQQQQQQQPGSSVQGEGEDTAILESVLADLEMPAAKRQKLQQPQQQQAAPAAANAAAAAGQPSSSSHAAAVAAAAWATGTTAAGDHCAGAAKGTQGAPGPVPLAGGRAEVYHEVLEAVHGPDEVLLRCHNPYKVCWVCVSGTGLPAACVVPRHRLNRDCKA